MDGEMTRKFLNAESAAAELTRRSPNSPWTPDDLLREVRAERLPACFEFEGEMTIASIDGVWQKENTPPRHLAFDGVVRSLARPAREGLLYPVAVVEILEVYGAKYTHSNLVLTWGVNLPTEFDYGGSILPGHRALCYVEDLVVTPSKYLFYIDDLAKLVPMPIPSPDLLPEDGLTAATVQTLSDSSDAVECGTKAKEVASGTETPIDFGRLATRSQLIEVFGPFTGMNGTWFKKLDDVPGLKAARKYRGQGGHGHVAEPLFCPFQVMLWLTNPKRKKGSELGVVKGWELLELHFSKVYCEKSVGDPRTW